MKTAALGQVASIERSGIDPAQVGSDTRYIGLEHIERGGRITSQETVASSAIKSTKFQFTPKHLLFGKLRPNLGKIARPKEPGVCSTDILPVLPGPSLDRDFLFHYLSQPRMIDLAASQATGANLPRISPKTLEAFQIPLPPLEEQRRIAAILDRADKILRQQHSVMSEFDHLGQAVFAEMFGDPATWPERWPMGCIGDMAEDVQYGTSSKAGDGGRWPIVRMGNVTDQGRLDLGDLKWIDLTADEVSKFTLRRGDLLFNRTNSKEKVGKTCVVKTDEPLAFAGYLVRVRLKADHRPEFVNAFLTSRYGQVLRRGMAKAAVNQANINATEMKSIPIALPPRGIQTAFAETMESLDAARLRQLAAIQKGEDLFISLQSRAFSGKL